MRKRIRQVLKTSLKRIRRGMFIVRARWWSLAFRLGIWLTNHANAFVIAHSDELFVRELFAPDVTNNDDRYTRENDERY